MHDFYNGKRVVVTGGASFIGSHLVERLQEFGASVAVIDNFSSGKRQNLAPGTDLVVGDLQDIRIANEVLGDAQIVFHLAAVHGGRGFIETKQQKMLANFAIDNNVFSSSKNAQVIVHASSACAYPIELQASESGRGLLREGHVDFLSPDGTFPDGVYGWTKLIGEMQLESTVSATGQFGRSARIFTAYGERENESHAVVALIAKALLGMDPFSIWGTGAQTRNFTYVSDTVHGLLLLGSDATGQRFEAVNIGTSKHTSVNELVEVIFEELQWSPSEVLRDTSKPTGVSNRASDNARIIEKFGWEPSTDVREGLRKTIEWYRSKADRPSSLDELNSLLMSR